MAPCKSVPSELDDESECTMREKLDEESLALLDRAVSSYTDLEIEEATQAV